MNRTIRQAAVASAVLVSGLLTGATALAQGYSTNVIDGVAVDDSAVDYVVGTNDTYNALVILDGGSLTNVNGIIGFQMGADFNAAYVTNAGSAWINSDVLYVGYEGVSNSLTIAAGGLVNDFVGYVGSQSNDNVAVVTGAGSVWTNSFDLTVGYVGSGNALTVTNGGDVSSRQGFVGGSGGGNDNTALVTGSGSVWGNSSNLFVGAVGSENMLTIATGGSVYDGSVYDGSGYLGSIFASGSNNSVLVSGSGSLWSNSASLYVGFASTYQTSGNTLTITNGGAVYNGFGYVGTNGTGNAVVVAGTGSVWNNSRDLYVGLYGARNVLTISGGGAVSNSKGFVGGVFYSASSSNAVLVTGTGSVWHNANHLSVGYLGAGNSMTISNGGAVYNDVGYIGNQAGADDNAVLVTGPGSVWSNAFGLSVGLEGAENTLTISNGGAVYVLSNGGSYIGSFNGAKHNAVLVTGSGSVWNNATSLNVGWNDTGNSLTIVNGGAVYSTQGTIGGSSNSTVLVTGSGSVWSNAGSLIVGYDGGSNSLTIADGGVVYNAASYIGYQFEADNNAVVVTGNGSVWSSANDLYVGYRRMGNSLTIADNGSVVAHNAYIGYVYTNGGNGITVSGGGLSVGSGVLDVRDGALTLNSGTVTVNQLVLTNEANSVIAFNGGLLTSSGTSVTNGQTFVVGDGTDAATFQLNGGVHSFADNLEISSNAVLTGCGTINGNVTIDPGGTVLADCGGALAFTGIVTNNGSVIAANGTTINFFGPVVNNGVIDAINGSVEFLGGLVNNGCVLTATDVQISSIARSGTDITVRISSGGSCGTYQLHVTPSLKPASWANLGAPQGGTGGVLTFTDTGGATNRPSRFYRIDVTLP